jgi:hypothetical protein
VPAWFADDTPLTAGQQVKGVLGVAFQAGVSRESRDELLQTSGGRVIGGVAYDVSGGGAFLHLVSPH